MSSQQLGNLVQVCMLRGRCCVESAVGKPDATRTFIASLPL
jgi:hypothetical protein